MKVETPFKDEEAMAGWFAQSHLTWLGFHIGRYSWVDPWRYYIIALYARW